MTRREVIWIASLGLANRARLTASGPQNLSYPLSSVERTITSVESLFVRDHFPEPDVPLDTWKLRVEGAVEQPFELGFADLVELPSRRIETVLECAGNAPNGSAVSNGVWEGVPISMLLERARPAANATSVLLEGADSGTLFEGTPPLPYSQIVTMAKCEEPTSLVAFKYNDLTLPKRNGFPARALFPGWYGMDSVKWLRRITVLSAVTRETNFERSGMDRLYNRVSGTSPTVPAVRLSQVQVKSAVAWPPDRSKIPAGDYTVWGFAWSGSNVVRRLTVSTNGGTDWQPAILDRQADRHSWVRWSYRWNARPGEYALMSRASDASGNEQPVKRDPARKDGYELNWCPPIHCSVR